MDLGIPGLEQAEPLGSGGFGAVYRARQPRLNRTVAVKVLPRTTGDPTAELRFQREAAALGTLSGHPNIVTVYDSGLSERGEPYLVMELVSRGSLADEVASSGPLSWGRVLEVAVGLSGALESAHGAGILHRDIKPANVLVSDFGEPQLADFGIARMEGAGQTQSAQITGSAAHLAPELLHGEPPSVASDVYALGSTLFHLLAGTPAFVRSTDQTIAAAYQRILTAEVPDLRPAGVPGEVCDLIEQMLSKDPASRPVSARQVGERARELQRAAGLEPTPLLVREASRIEPILSDETAAVPVSGATAAVDDATAATPAPARPARKAHDTGTDAEAPPLRQPVEPARRRPPAGLLVGGAAALLVGGIAFAALSGGNGDGADQTAGAGATAAPSQTPGGADATDGAGAGTATAGGDGTGSSTSPMLSSTYSPCTRYAAPDGRTGGDGSLEAPFGSVVALAESLGKGETGCLRGGTYAEEIDFDENVLGTLDEPVTVAAVMGEEPVLIGGMVVQPESSNLVLDGLVFVGASAQPPLTLQTFSATVSNATFSNPDGPCLVIDALGQGETDMDVVSTSDGVTLTGLLALRCGAGDGAAVVVRGNADVRLLSSVLHVDQSGPAAMILVEDARRFVGAYLTLIGSAAPLAVDALGDADRVVALTNVLVDGAPGPVLDLLAAEDEVGRVSVDTVCLSPTATAVRFGPVGDGFVSVETETVGDVVFTDTSTGDYSVAVGSGCQGFGVNGWAPRPLDAVT